MAKRKIHKSSLRIKRQSSPSNAKSSPIFEPFFPITGEKVRAPKTLPLWLGAKELSRLLLKELLLSLTSTGSITRSLPTAAALPLEELGPALSHGKRELR